MRAAVACRCTVPSARTTCAVFRALWVDGLDLNRAPLVAQVLHSAGLDPAEILELAGRADVKAQLRATTDETVARGVFGAPTMFVGEQMFFGQDRLDFVREGAGPRKPLEGRYMNASATPGKVALVIGAGRLDRQRHRGALRARGLHRVPDAPLGGQAAAGRRRDPRGRRAGLRLRQRRAQRRRKSPRWSSASNASTAPSRCWCSTSAPTCPAASSRRRRASISRSGRWPASAASSTPAEVALRMVGRSRGTILFTGATRRCAGRPTSRQHSRAPNMRCARWRRHGARARAEEHPSVAHVVVDGAIDTEFIRSSFPERYALGRAGRHPRSGAHRRQLLAPARATARRLDLRAGSAAHMERW